MSDVSGSPRHSFAATAPSAAELRERAQGENFPVALRVLRADHRRHLLAIYDYARLVDELGDSAAGDRLALLDEFEAVFDEAVRGGATHPVLREVARSIHEAGLSLTPFHRLVEANRQDQRVHRYASYRDLLGYCELSANPVGRLVLEVFGVSTPARVAWSDAVCSGLQLVEHWQDVGEDFAAGRIYLPGEDLERFGCREEALGAARADEATRALLRFEVRRAHRLLDDGVPLIRSLRGRPRLAISGFVAGGRAALDAIARNDYDVLAKPAKPRRARLLARLLGAFVAPRRLEAQS